MGQAKSGEKIMEIKEFLSFLAKTKSSQISTGYTEIKVKKFTEEPCFILYSTHECPTCHRGDVENKLEVKFKEDQGLTIFEADLLFMLWIEKKKPKDYANYHQCFAGRKFIENIDSVKILEMGQ